MKREVISGIYSITNPKGEIYIGRSKDIYKRWVCHKAMGHDTIVKLYESFVSYGLWNHVFKIVERCPEEELVVKEAIYQIFYDCFNSGLNSKPQSKKLQSNDTNRTKNT